MIAQLGLDLRCVNEMIAVEFMPAGERSPLPHGERIYNFLSFSEFKKWVQGYVCIHCLNDFKDMTEKDPETIEDWLSMGCGYEIYIEDPNTLIDWDAKMVLPENWK